MKRLAITLTVLAFCLGLAGAGLPAKGAPSLGGTWTGSYSFASWTSGFGFYFGPSSPAFTLSMVVEQQDLASGNFCGHMIRLLNGQLDASCPMTGNVSTKKIITGCVQWGGPGDIFTFDAKVMGTKISGVFNRGSNDNAITTGKFDLVKQP